MCALCVTVFVCVCERGGWHQESPEGGIRFSGAGITRGHQSLDSGAENRLGPVASVP